MKVHPIGAVCRLLGLKPHILRYWEENNPLLSGRRGASGRREYTAGDIDLLIRMKRLILEKRYTVEGARLLLAEELAGSSAEARFSLANARRELVRARDRGGSRQDAGLAGLERLVQRIPEYPRLPPDRKAGWMRLLRGFDAGLAASVAGLLSCAPEAAPSLPELPAGCFSSRTIDQSAWLEAPAGEPTAYASLLCRPVYRLPALMSALRRLVPVVTERQNPSGPPTRWFIFHDAELSPRLAQLGGWLKALLGRTCRLGLVPLARFPALDLRGRFGLDAGDRLAGYPPGFAGLCACIRSRAMLRLFKEEGIQRLVILPVNRWASPERCTGLQIVHGLQAAHITIALCPDSAPALTTGLYVLDCAFLGGLGPAQVYRREVYRASQTADTGDEEALWRIVSHPWELARHTERTVAIRLV